MLHIYHGSGKGKTTAAFGLALRQVAYEKKVCVIQFLKDGKSGETQSIAKLSNVNVFVQPLPQAFFYQMNEQQQQECKAAQQYLWSYVEEHMSAYDCVILDELLDAIHLQLLSQQAILSTLKAYRAEVEIVVTGRAPSIEMRALADYDMEIIAHKHPYENGISARIGVEY